MPGDEMLKTTVEIFEKLLNANTVVGKPLEFEDKVVIPIAGFGFGFGGGEGPGSDKSCVGAGSGGGAGMNPVAVIVIHKDITGHEGIQVLSLKRMNPMTEAITESIPRIADSIPKVIDALRSKQQHPPSQ